MKGQTRSLKVKNDGKKGVHVSRLSWQRTNCTPVYHYTSIGLLPGMNLTGMGNKPITRYGWPENMMLQCVMNNSDMYGEVWSFWWCIAKHDEMLRVVLRLHSSFFFVYTAKNVVTPAKNQSPIYLIIGNRDIFTDGKMLSTWIKRNNGN